MDVGPVKPVLLVGGMGIGKSAILTRFVEEQPFVLSAVARSGIDNNHDQGEPSKDEFKHMTDEVIDDIGCQFGLPRRSVLGT